MKRGADRKTSPGAARFRQLVERALFELRLAADVARAEGYGRDVTSPVEESKRNLRACLELLEGRRENAA